ncbi:MAG: UDP-N-acetylmuramate dehydrogenase [Oscillospiraceae bacterium]
MFNELDNIIKKYACEFRLNASMSEFTSIKTGGIARYIVMPNCNDAIKDILNFCIGNKIKYYVIGNASNLLISDDGLDGVVIRITSALSKIEYLGNGFVRCESGASLSKLCVFALKHNLSGLEFAYGIPGTAGGAAFMNAGAYGGEMKDVLFSCEHIDKNGNFGELSQSQLDLSYRHSAYSDNDFIITALTVKLNAGNYNEIKSLMDDKMSRRIEKQPLDFPSAGSIFKRPEGFFAGALIEECGLKGASVGGAMVSKKHAGFIINNGNATTTDVLKLIELIQNKIFSEKNIHLETEVKYLD